MISVARIRTSYVCPSASVSVRHVDCVWRSLICWNCDIDPLFRLQAIWQKETSYLLLYVHKAMCRIGLISLIKKALLSCITVSRKTTWKVENKILLWRTLHSPVNFFLSFMVSILSCRLVIRAVITMCGYVATNIEEWDVARLVERRTGTPLTQVRFPGTVRDFSSRVNFRRRLSYSVSTALMCNRMH